MKSVVVGALLLLGAAVGGCPRAEQAAAPAVTPAPTPTAAPAKPSRKAEEACVDRWLAARGFDPYGGPDGTMYAGGTPLFDERTGERRDRLEYVYKLHPAARDTCRQPPTPH
jgi:hypothetical protein